MNNKLYQALVQHYYSLQSERKAIDEQINVLRARYQAIDEQMVQVNDILCKHGNHIYEHFEEGLMTESVDMEVRKNDN